MVVAPQRALLQPQITALDAAEASGLFDALLIRRPDPIG
jgi:hypothetical protein